MNRFIGNLPHFFTTHLEPGAIGSEISTHDAELPAHGSEISACAPEIPAMIAHLSTAGAAILTHPVEIATRHAEPHTRTADHERDNPATSATYPDRMTNTMETAPTDPEIKTSAPDAPAHGTTALKPQ